MLLLHALKLEANDAKTVARFTALCFYCNTRLLGSHLMGRLAGWLTRTDEIGCKGYRRDSFFKSYSPPEATSQSFINRPSARNWQCLAMPSSRSVPQVLLLQCNRSSLVESTDNSCEAMELDLLKPSMAAIFANTSNLGQPKYSNSRHELTLQSAALKSETAGHNHLYARRLPICLFHCLERCIRLQPQSLEAAHI